jgi:hypothetical protein
LLVGLLEQRHVDLHVDVCYNAKFNFIIPTTSSILHHHKSFITTLITIYTNIALAADVVLQRTARVETTTAVAPNVASRNTRVRCCPDPTNCPM